MPQRLYYRALNRGGKGVMLTASAFADSIECSEKVKSGWMWQRLCRASGTGCLLLPPGRRPQGWRAGKPHPGARPNFGGPLELSRKKQPR